MTVHLNLTMEEQKIAEAYAKSKGMSLSDAIKEVFFEKIEDEYDAAVFDSAYREYEKDSKTYTHEEVKKLLDL